MKHKQTVVLKQLKENLYFLGVIIHLVRVVQYTKVKKIELNPSDKGKVHK